MELQRGGKGEPGGFLNEILENNPATYIEYKYYYPEVIDMKTDDKVKILDLYLRKGYGVSTFSGVNGIENQLNIYDVSKIYDFLHGCGIDTSHSNGNYSKGVDCGAYPNLTDDDLLKIAQTRNIKKVIDNKQSLEINNYHDTKIKEKPHIYQKGSENNLILNIIITIVFAFATYKLQEHFGWKWYTIVATMVTISLIVEVFTDIRDRFQ